MVPDKKIAAIVLAAGRSERMGSPKALLDFDGKTCLALAKNACREGGVNNIIVVLGYRADDIIAAGETDGMRTALNRNWRAGRSSSLKTGLRELPEDTAALLMFPVDCPLAGAGVVRALIGAYRARSADKRVFIPSHNYRAGHPVLIDVSLRDELLALGDDEPARNVLSRDKSIIEYVVTENAGVLFNMNTPADYRECLRRYRKTRNDEAGHLQADRETG